MRLAAVPIVIAAVAGIAAGDDVSSAALVHLDRGVAAFEAGDFTRARREFSAANDLAPERANPYRWLALTEIQLGDCASAIDHIDGFVTRVDKTDARLPEMTRWRDLCSRSGKLQVESRPPLATLRIDGSVVGPAPYRSLSMRAGEHTVVAELPGHVAASRTVVLAPEGDISLLLELPATRSASRPWWFWPSIGAGVAAVVTAGVIVYARSGSDDTVLPPIRCDALGCVP
jgi:hypothetical protein